MTVTFKAKPVQLQGHFPKIHTKAPDFLLVDKNLGDCSLHSFQGKKKVIATVPSLDTGTCSKMTKHINEFAKKHPECVFITVSADLPFAQKRFCEQEAVHNVITLSMMRNKDFGKAYGLLIDQGPLAGLLTRALLVLDAKDHVLHVEVVSEITEEPNYHKAFELLNR